MGVCVVMDRIGTFHCKSRENRCKVLRYGDRVSRTLRTFANVLPQNGSDVVQGEREVDAILLACDDDTFREFVYILMRNVQLWA